MLLVTRPSQFSKAYVLLKNEIPLSDKNKLNFHSLPTFAFKSEKLADAFIYRYKKRTIK